MDFAREALSVPGFRNEEVGFDECGGMFSRCVEVECWGDGDDNNMVMFK